MPNVMVKLIFAIVALIVFLLFSPLIIGILLDTFTKEGSALVVALLLAVLVAVAIAQRRRKNARAGSIQELP